MGTPLLSDAEVSKNYFEHLARLSKELGDGGIAVYGHRYDALSFGSWVVDAGTRHRRVRVTYDGREGLLRFAREHDDFRAAFNEAVEALTLRMIDGLKLADKEA